MNRHIVKLLLILAVIASAQTTPGKVWSEIKISGANSSLSVPSGSFLGSSIADIGDIDGDGISDLAVGAENEAGTGAIYIINLNADQSIKKSTKITTNPNLALSVGDYFGSSVAGIGDFNNDGVRDIIVGVRGDDTGGVNFGACYLIYLNSDGTMKSSQKITSATNGFLSGDFASNDNFGYSIAVLGDINNDSFIEIAVGANGYSNFKGSVWILSLNSNGTIANKKRVSSEIADLKEFDSFGYSLSMINDLDGDGIRELLVGAPLSEEAGNNGTGGIYIINLNSNFSVKKYTKITKSHSLLTSQLDNFDNFGVAICSPGDIDKNGTSDIVVGAYGDDDGANSAGANYILFMENDGSPKTIQKLSSTSGSLKAISANSQFGSSLASIGDLDNNGVVGIISGLPNLNESAFNQGGINIIHLYGNAITDSVSSIQTTKATLHGTVNPYGINSSIVFEYGLTSNYGSVSTATQIAGSSDQKVAIELTDLQSGKDYFYRIKATNSRGFTYGQERKFKTRNAAPVIVERLPIDSLITIKKDSTLTFSITATDAEGDLLKFKWFNNDEIQSSTNNLFTLKFSELGEFTVKAKVSDNLSSDSTAWIITVLDASSLEENQPKTTQMYQNYPNPFNPDTQINFDLATAENVQIAIYNYKGELVKRLVNDFRKAGKYSVVLQGARLSSGVYYCKMTTGSYSKVSKMIMLK